MLIWAEDASAADTVVIDAAGPFLAAPGVTLSPPWASPTGVFSATTLGELDSVVIVETDPAGVGHCTLGTPGLRLRLGVPASSVRPGPAPACPASPPPIAPRGIPAERIPRTTALYWPDGSAAGVAEEETPFPKDQPLSAGRRCAAWTDAGFVPGEAGLILCVDDAALLAGRDLPVRFRAAGLTTKKRVNPRWPPQVVDRDHAECRADVVIEPDGRPRSVVVRPDPSCPAPFAASVQDSVLKWRWKPPLAKDGVPAEDGAPVAAATIVKVNFLLDRPGR